MVEVFKQFTFEAAHTLPQYPQIHGHSYSVEVRVAGDAGDGYVVPIDVLEREINALRQRLDHGLLNDLIDVPTSENIARYIFDALKPALNLTRVKVWRPSLGFGAIVRATDACG
jgi:6-pyruvoyltetrahydropterin/6-carboxytetrahydropterin synthase